MHEMSLIESVLETIRRHAPASARVLSVKLEAGALLGVDPQAMQWAWQAATVDGFCHGARLDLTLLPWSLTCDSCGRVWTDPDPYSPCPCGGAALPRGTAEMRLVSFEIDD